MAYARDKLEKGFLRQNRSRIAREVKATDMLLHLPCLTTSDMEEVEAASTTKGNMYAMGILLGNLVRRQNWPEHFISALEECEHPTLAQEMRDEYEALKQPSNQKQKPTSPSARPATVTPAHFHSPSPPVSSPASPPVNTPASPPVNTPALPSAPIHSPPQAAESVSLPKSSPLPSKTTGSPFPTVATPQPPTYPSTTPAVSSPASPPAPIHSPPEVPESVPLPKSSPPPSRTTGSPFPTVAAPQAPTYPSTTKQPAFQPNIATYPAPGSSTVVMPETSPSAVAVAMALPAEGAQGPEVSLTPEQDVTHGPVRSVRPAKVSEPPSLAMTGAGAGLGPWGPFHAHTSESLQSTKAPIQETSPPSCKEVPFQPEPVETSEESLQQVTTQLQVRVSSEDTEVCPPPGRQNTTSPPPVTAAASAAAPALGSALAMIQQHSPPTLVDSDSEEECFSKPGVLRTEVEVPCSVTSGRPPQEPCSVTSDDLEISTAARSSAHGPVTRGSYRSNSDPQAESSARSRPSAAGPCPEPVMQVGQVSNPTEADYKNPAFSSHRIPTEDYYDSQCSDAADQSTMVHVVHVSQEPSVQNWGGQTPRIPGNVVYDKDKAVVNHSDRQHDEAEQQLPTTHFRSLDPQSIVGNVVHVGGSTKNDAITEKIVNTSHKDENRRQEEEEERNENEHREVPSAVLPLISQNVPLIPAAALVIGVAAILVWKIRN